MQGFIDGIGRGGVDPERDSRMVQDFMEHTESHFRGHSLWRVASEEEVEASGEGLEKYLMTKLYTRTFAASDADKEQDTALSRRLTALRGILRPEHLDIPSRFHNEATWVLAQKELHKINQYKAPRD